MLDELAAKPFEECEAVWRKLLRTMKLELMYVLPIREVLKEERWRKKENPVGYVKKAAQRQAVRMGLVEKPRNERELLARELNYTDWDGEPLRHDEKLDQAEHEFQIKYVPARLWDLPTSRVKAVMMHKNGVVNWEKVAVMANLNTPELIVLEMRAIGFTRELALKACYDEDDRRYIQAAWRRVERHKWAISKVLKSGKEVKCKREEIEPREMILIAGENGEVRMAFRRIVAAEEGVCPCCGDRMAGD